MSAPAMTVVPVSYSLKGAAAAAGVSLSTIKREVDAGRLAVHYPTAERGKPLILADELAAWVLAGPGKTGSATGRAG